MQEIEPRLSRRQRRASEREQGRMARKGAAVASGAALAVGALASGQPAEAATFNVTNLDDNGAGSLRQAIVDANSAAGADVITFQAGLTGTITLTGGQLYITDSVEIQGPGPAALTVSGNNASRVFYVYDGSALLDATISGLTITGGNASIGAGVINWGEDLLLDDVVITGNTAGDGAGIEQTSEGGSLTIRNSVISGNNATGTGGGLRIYYAGAAVTIQNTVISGNDASLDGAGIYANYLQDDLTIENSTISGNDSQGDGGGVYVLGAYSGTLTVRGTTISGNTADSGGGLMVRFLYAPVVIENSTISGNQATSGSGGGVYLYTFYNGGSATLRHVTIAGNSASGTGGGVFAGVIRPVVVNSLVANNIAASNNDLGNGPDGSFDLSVTLVESPGTANINDNGGNIFNQDPQLGPLQNNGGPTQTHLPAGTSPAVNAGNNADSLPADQRGVARPAGTRVDMGAVEVSPGTIQLAVNAVSVNETAGTVTITATRTGGTDGAVSVSYNTSDGTAVAPGDYAAAAGSLNWASGDGTPKTFQVTIVNDTDDEADETFNATISNPQGGATLGAITTEVVTIVEDGAAGVADIPTLGEVGRLLFAGLAGLTGYLKLRRRKEK
ncbi:MAG TPA: choice-of-anchor Q domain-containing protein [Thermoanaerobaculia bacterium]|nr:choice-of-anchor Q domain-containing protein [Thermoanaerobaculia bacterium]